MSAVGNAILEDLIAKMGEVDSAAYEVCGFIDKSGKIYPLGSDTKVLSTAFELITRPTIHEIAKKHGLSVVEAEKQNFYPDFTLLKSGTDRAKIAVDVKTTYRDSPEDKFSFTLGGYTSFIRTPTKNILYHFDDYADHLIIGFVYDRIGKKKATNAHTFTVNQLKEIEIPLSSVQVFVQEKWRIASDRPGSGNTANMGSIRGMLEDFVEGHGVFESEAEFLAYWRQFNPSAAARRMTFNDIKEFRALQKKA